MYTYTDTPTNPEVQTVSEWQQQVADMKQRIEELEKALSSALNACNHAEAKHRSDINNISILLLEEAEERSWCSEFDDFVAAANRSLHIPLTEREKEYTITFTVTLTGTTTVSSRSEHAADEDAQDLMEGFPSYVTMGGITFDVDDTLYKVEED